MRKNCKIIFAAALVIAVTIFLFAGCQLNGDEKQSAVLSNKFGNFYNTGVALIPLENLDSFKPITYYDDKKSEDRIIGFNNYRAAFSDNVIYAQEGDDASALYKYKFVDRNTLKRSVWVDETTLLNSVVVPSTSTHYSNNMVGFSVEGNYVYFICYPGRDCFSVQQEIAFKLGRISKDGKTIEFINDEVATAYTVSNGWIYFFDNGYTYDGNDGYSYRIDENRAGIYKMKCDGSDKQLLKGNFKKDSADENPYNGLCDKMNIHEDYLYFVDYSESGESKLYRMRTDGTKLECLTQNGVENYTVDYENEIIYYTDGQLRQIQFDNRSLYKVSINDNKEEEILYKAVLGGRYAEMSYFDNFIYFTDDAKYLCGVSKDNPGVIGMRYDLSDGKTDIFKSYAEVEFDKDTGRFLGRTDPVYIFEGNTDTQKLY